MLCQPQRELARNGATRPNYDGRATACEHPSDCAPRDVCAGRRWGTLSARILRPATHRWGADAVAAGRGRCLGGGGPGPLKPAAPGPGSPVARAGPDRRSLMLTVAPSRWGTTLNLLPARRTDRHPTSPRFRLSGPHGASNGSKAAATRTGAARMAGPASMSPAHRLAGWLAEWSTCQTFRLAPVPPASSSTDHRLRCGYLPERVLSPAVVPLWW